VVIRPEDWDLVGGNPAPGDPDAVGGLAQQFRTVADDAGNVHLRLQQIKDAVDEAIWRGKSANEFRGKLEKLPEHFRKLHDSYDKAASGTSKYATTMRDLQGRAATELGKAQTAHDSQTGSEQARDAALAADPNAVVATHDNAVAAARTQLQSAIDEIGKIRSEFQAAEGAVLDSLHEAHEVGMHNRTGLQKFLTTIADVAEQAAFVLAVVGIVVVVVVFIASGGGILGLIGALAAAEQVFFAATVVSAVALGAKWFDWKIGDFEAPSLRDLIKDTLITTAAFGVGKVLDVFRLPTTSVLVDEFASITTKVRPAQFLGMVGDAALFAPRTVTVEVTIVRVTTVVRTLEEAHLGTLWDVGWSRFYELPKYLSEHEIPSTLLRDFPAAIRDLDPEDLKRQVTGMSGIKLHHVSAGSAS
jgi:uncharacterized protein YukE